MSSEEEEIIIIGKKQATSLLPRGFVHPVSVLKQYSTWVLIAVVALPEAFQLAVSYGIVSPAGGEDALSKVAQVMAAVGLVLKVISQKKQRP